MGAERGDITRILERLTEPGSSAGDALLPLVYDELRALAGSFFEHQDPGHTLQPTALVHEAYLRLVNQADPNWDGRDHFFAVAALAMRQILVDHARRRRAAKRGGAWGRITLDEAISSALGSEIDFVALEEALRKLGELDERKGQVVTLRYFGGLTHEAVARVLGISRTTVAEDWRVARAFLARQLRETLAS